MIPERAPSGVLSRAPIRVIKGMGFPGFRVWLTWRVGGRSK